MNSVIVSLGQSIDVLSLLKFDVTLWAAAQHVHRLCNFHWEKCRLAFGKLKVFFNEFEFAFFSS